MDTIEIKSELQQMIEMESDVTILEAIRAILRKTSVDPVLQQKLTSRALKSEQAIKEGRVFSREEVVKRTQR
jgi:hypothetical protein